MRRICYLRAAQELPADRCKVVCLVVLDAVGCISCSSSGSSSSSECAACSPSIDFQWRYLLFSPRFTAPAAPFIHSSLSVSSSFSYVPSYFPAPQLFSPYFLSVLPLLVWFFFYYFSLSLSSLSLRSLCLDFSCKKIDTSRWGSFIITIFTFLIFISS